MRLPAERDVTGHVGLPHLDGVGPRTSWASVGALVLQLLPPSSEYSTVAPFSTPVSVSEASLVTWSLPEVPVSLESATPKRRRHGLVDPSSAWAVWGA